MGKRSHAVTVDVSALKEHRARCEMTQVDLALASGCSLALIGMIESGDRQPSIDTVERMAAALDVDVHEIASIAEVAA